LSGGVIAFETMMKNDIMLVVGKFLKCLIFELVFGSVEDDGLNKRFNMTSFFCE